MAINDLISVALWMSIQKKYKKMDTPVNMGEILKKQKKMNL